MSEFWKAYKDPRWQRRRLEVLDAYGWTCQRCRCTDKQLQVHHNFYIKDRMPWDYDDLQFDVLCDDCHVWATAQQAKLRVVLSYVWTTRLPNLIDTLADFAANPNVEICTTYTRSV